MLTHNIMRIRLDNFAMQAGEREDNPVIIRPRPISHLGQAELDPAAAPGVRPRSAPAPARPRSEGAE